MKKLLLTAACLLIAGNAVATTLDVTQMRFYDAGGTLSFTDNSTTGAIDFTTGTGGIHSGIPFNGYDWTAVVVVTFTTAGANNWNYTSIQGNGTYSFTLAPGQVGVALKFDWPIGTGSDIPVLAVFDDSDGDGSWTAVNTGDTDASPGTRMKTPPFKGQTPAFYGTINLPPTLTLTGANPQGMPSCGTYTELGYTATDDKIDPITAVITGADFDTCIAGDHTVTYTVNDGANPAVVQTRTVNVSDLPVCTLVPSDNPVYVLLNGIYAPPAVTCEDAGGALTVTGGGDTVDTNIAATYHPTFSATNGAGTTTVDLAVVVYANTAPVINITGDDPVTAECNGSSSFLPLVGAECVDTAPPVDITANLVADTTGVDFLTVAADAGDITYTCVDNDGAAATPVTRVVEVTDTRAPSLTLKGLSSIDVPVGQRYVDAGATCADLCEGTLTASTIIDGVNTADVDTDFVSDTAHVVEYSCVDSSGNEALHVTRTVNVVECAVNGAIINNFTMYTGSGGIVGGSNNVYFTWDTTTGPNHDGLLDETAVVDGQEIVPGNATLGTSCKFFGFPWFADPVWIYGPGTYTFDACPAGAVVNNFGSATDGSGYCTPGEAANMITLTVGEEQVGAHMLFEWSTSSKIDMLVLWDKNTTAKAPMTTDCGGADANIVWDLASVDADADVDDMHIPGAGFVDGPFRSFSGNMNLMRPDSQVSRLPQDVPVLEIQGDNPLLVTPDSDFTCPAAMAEDMVDSTSGPICDKITSVGCDKVNTGVPGAYTVTYQVVDNDGNKVSHDLLAIVFGAADEVPDDAGISGNDPLVIFGDTVNHPVIVMNAVLDADGNPVVLLNNEPSINVTLGDDCDDPGFAAYDMKDGVLTAADMTTVSTIDCNKPGHYTLTYTATDHGANPAPAGIAAAAADSLVTTVVRHFNVNAIPTADEQLPAEVSENADVGGGCSASNGQNHPLQRADLLLLGGFLAALGLRRVKRSDV